MAVVIKNIQGWPYQVDELDPTADEILELLHSNPWYRSEADKYIRDPAELGIPMIEPQD